MNLDTESSLNLMMERSIDPSMRGYEKQQKMSPGLFNRRSHAELLEDQGLKTYLNHFHFMKYSRKNKMHSKSFSAHSCLSQATRERQTHTGTYTRTEVRGLLCEVLLHQNLDQPGSCSSQSYLTAEPLQPFFQNKLKRIFNQPFQ